MTISSPTRLHKFALFREHLYLLVVLIGLLPCIYDYSLFFFDLGFNLLQEEQSFFSHLWRETGLPFLIGLCLAPYVIFQILKRGEWQKLLGLLPYLIYVLSYVEVHIICSENYALWESLLYVTSIISWLYFLIRGDLLNWVFPLFLLFIWIQMSSLQMVLFAGYSLAFRLIILLITQNWSIIKDLGFKRFFLVFFRTFLLWSPMILVIAFSLWSTQKIEDKAVGALYDVSFLDHFPYPDESSNDSVKIEPSVSQDSLNHPLLHKIDSLNNRLKRLNNNERLLARRRRRIGRRIQTPISAQITEVSNLLRTLEIKAKILKEKGIINRAAFNNPTLVDSCFLEDSSSLSHSFWTGKRKRQFERDLKVSLCIEVEQKKLEVHATLDKLMIDLKDQQDAIPKEAGALVRRSFAGIAPQASQVNLKCPIYRLDCHIGEGATKAAVSASGEAFDIAGQRLARNVENKVRGLANKAGNSITYDLKKVKAEVDAELDAIEKDTYHTLIHTYRLIRFILLVLDLIFFFIVVKSFAYVFARVVFSRDGGRFITLLEKDDTTMDKGAILASGNSYKIPADSAESFFVSRKYEPSGRAPKIAIPQLFKSFVGRLFAGAWAMNYVVVDTNRSDVKFNAPGGKEFMEWSLAPGEIVIFRYKNFVAMSDRIKLSSIVSLRITSLLFGRMVFSAAEGPGKLILSTKGKPISGEEPEANHSIPESRLLAWQKHARFNIESELNVFDVFFSGVYLQKQAEDLVIIDSDQVGKAKSGIFKFFRHFLLPI